MVSCECRSNWATGMTEQWLELFGYLILQAIKNVSLFGKTAQLVERVHSKHKVMGLNPTPADILYGIRKP